MSKKLNFAEAIAYMTANPGSELVNPFGKLVRNIGQTYFSYAEDTGFWDVLGGFSHDDIKGQWSIPEPELPEVEVNIYLGKSGYIYLTAPGSKEDNYCIRNNYTKCKIKFNQGEE